MSFYWNRTVVLSQSRVTCGQTGKISAREASPAVAWGDYLSEPIFFRLRRFFFPFSLNAEPGSWLPVRL